MPRSHDDRFPVTLWETRFCSTLGVPIPALSAFLQRCSRRHFRFDPYVRYVSVETVDDHRKGRNHLQSIVNHIEIFLTGNNKRNYVVLPRGQDNYLPPRPLILEWRSSDDALKNAARKKILHYRRIYADWIPGSLHVCCSNFLHLLFSHASRDASSFAGDTNHSPGFIYTALHTSLSLHSHLSHTPYCPPLYSQFPI